MELNELIQSIDIVEYISQFVDLTLKGDEYWGLSCFKDEKTPSFSVRQTPPVFFDYSSGIGGNVYTFIRKYNNCSPAEAVDIMRKYLNCNECDVTSRQKLSSTEICKKYKKKNGGSKESKVTIFPDDVMDRYEKDDEKLMLWKNEGISEGSIQKFQISYDRFSNRLVYPIRNMEGKIVNIGGRTVDPLWKEKNMRKYCYFYPWGTLNTIYGLSENMKEIKGKGEIILFEGCKSVLLADSWGVENTGAILTSHLNPHQMKILAKLGCRVVFALDKDVDIRRDHNINKLKNYVNVEYICDTENLIGDKDSPVDRGFATFEQLYYKKRKLY